MSDIAIVFYKSQAVRVSIYTYAGMEGKNSTFFGPSWKLNYVNLPQIVICSLGVVSNSLLLYAFYKNPLKCFKYSGTFLIINLTVSDILMCFIGPVYASVNYEVITIGYKTMRFIAFALTVASILTITSISIDRFLLVAYAIRHCRLIKGKVLIIWPACIWLLASYYSSCEGSNFWKTII